MTLKFFPTMVAVDRAKYSDIPDIKKAMIRAGYAAVPSGAHTLAPTLLTQEYLETS